MRKKIRVENLCCADCAAKIERGIAALDGVESVNVNFMAQKINLEGDEIMMPRILDQAQHLITAIEPDCRILL